MRYGSAAVLAVALWAVGGCFNGPPSDVRVTRYPPPPGYGDDEELPLGSYDERGVHRIEVEHTRTPP